MWSGSLKDFKSKMSLFDFFSFMAISLSGDHDNYDAQAVRGGDVGSAPTPIAKPAARKPVGELVV